MLAREDVAPQSNNMYLRGVPEGVIFQKDGNSQVPYTPIPNFPREKLVPAGLRSGNLQRLYSAELN